MLCFLKLSFFYWKISGKRGTVDAFRRKEIVADLTYWQDYKPGSMAGNMLKVNNVRKFKSELVKDLPVTRIRCDVGFTAISLLDYLMNRQFSYMRKSFRYLRITRFHLNI